MQILAIGGSGIVGTLVLPALLVADYELLRRATGGTDALIYLAMGRPRRPA